jgi:hypothetical protein
MKKWPPERSPLAYGASCSWGSGPTDMKGGRGWLTTQPPLCYNYEMYGFFNRWVYLLIFLIFISVSMSGISYFVWNHHYENKYSPISDKCYEHLLSQDDSWEASSDMFYRTTCDLQNPSSDQSMQMQLSSRLGDRDDFYFNIASSLLSLLILSFLIRWLLTGKLKLQH